MKKGIIIVLACASLMLVTPFTVVARENKVISNLSDNQYIEGIVSQLRFVFNEIFQNYGYTSRVANLCNVILNILGFFGLFLTCIGLFFILLIIEICMFISVFFRFTGPFEDFFTEAFLFLNPIFDSLCFPSSTLNNLKIPLKSLYILSETKDIASLANKCSCLLE
jgi:hypothetical protein